jgi:hypothetical protein
MVDYSQPQISFKLPDNLALCGLGLMKTRGLAVSTNIDGGKIEYRSSGENCRF